LKKVKILHVITTLERGGAQRVLWNLLKSSKNNATKNYIICLSGKTNYADLFREIDVEVIFLNGTNIIQTFNVFFCFISNLNRIKPDLINSWLYHADLFVSFAKLFFVRSTPIIWSVHHASKTLSKESLHTKLSLKILTFLSYFIPEKIIYCSKLSQEIHYEIGYAKKNGIIIKNSIDNSIFKPNFEARKKVRKNLNISESEILIGLVARNDPNKGLKIFLDLVKSFKDQLKFKFIICGENMDYENLKSDFENNKNYFYRNLTLMGEIDSPENIFNAIDILICPSLKESFGLVALEAICSGTPVIASNIRAFQEILPKEFLVDKYTVKSFKKSIFNIIKKDKHYLKKLMDELRFSKSHEYSIDEMTKDYREIYRQLII
tara:strand:+ start:6825 stop:7958 length:1134 start_codon:yes stop_codon:yes gene_type:complete